MIQDDPVVVNLLDKITNLETLGYGVPTNIRKEHTYIKLCDKILEITQGRMYYLFNKLKKVFEYDNLTINFHKRINEILQDLEYYKIHTKRNYGYCRIITLQKEVVKLITENVVRFDDLLKIKILIINLKKEKDITKIFKDQYNITKLLNHYVNAENNYLENYLMYKNYNNNKQIIYNSNLLQKIDKNKFPDQYIKVSNCIIELLFNELLNIQKIISIITTM